MPFAIETLPSGLPVVLSPAPETPRIALAVGISGGIRREESAGTAKLANRLLMKGTEKRSAEELAKELDDHAIDLREVVFADCALLLAVFLNHELPTVLDILQDILLHSTFADFDKERRKLAGEISSSLDMPAEQAQDLLLRTMFAGDPYGHTGTVMLENLDSLACGQTRQWFAEGLDPLRMNVTLVGDMDTGEVLPQLDDAFGGIRAGGQVREVPLLCAIQEDQVVTGVRPDAQQAQIYQGWYAPRLGSPEQAATAVMNTILGGAGLSSRLFQELRDKQGLAYSVRSQYATMRQAGNFIASIGTSPENIERALQGFAEQISLMQDEPITFDELQHAKGRLSGLFVLSHETTSQRCIDAAVNHLYGLGPDYSERLLGMIAGVTVPDVQAAARRIRPPSVTALVAREDALPKH